MFTLNDFEQEFGRLSELLEAAHREIGGRVALYAETERVYRQAKARAWVSCPTGGDWTAAKREAWVNAITAGERRDRDIADGMRRATLESVRSLRGQLSAWQTLVNAWQEEAKFERVRPDI